MQIEIHGNNIEVTDALRDYIEKKLGKLQRYFEYPLRPQVALLVQKENQRVEITIPISNGRILRAEVDSENMYSSVDQAVDKLDRQVKKHKTRLNRKAREMPEDLMEEMAREAEEEQEEGEPRLVRTKSFTMKPMDAEEAILEMELLDHDFFVFTSAETDEVNVVYRRRDGNYGLIEPRA
ncbi:MAG: ribosome hibernation-promoting factor, HPF/YfiA family [Clostridia bacterium]